ncbi:MAG: DUF4340 domain-containing protein [bacterium]
MITRKSLGILVAALAVLIAASWMTSRSRYGAVSGGGFESLLAKPLDPPSVQTIRAWVGALPDSTVEITRKGDGWAVASRFGWKGKKDLVDRLLEDVKSLRGELRSSSASVLEDYQIDDKKGMHLVGLGPSGSEVFHVIVGKTSLKGGSFVRRVNSNDVFLCEASLRSPFGLWGEEVRAPDPKRWIELRVNETTRQDVDRIVLHDGTSETVLEKVFQLAPADTAKPKATADSTKKGEAAPAKPAGPTLDRNNWTWKPDKAGAIDKAKADGILSTLCNLYATDVVDPKNADQYGLAAPKRWADLVLKDGKTISVKFGNAIDAEKMVYLKIGDDGLPAKIYQSTVDRVFTKRSELKPKTT